MSPSARIMLVSKRLAPDELSKFIGNPFPDMVKFVADVDRNVLAVGGQLHVDGEAILLDDGSEQEALWGGNYYPGMGEGECIEYESLINLRPAQKNLASSVQDPAIRARIQSLVFALLGRGESLP